MSDDTTATTYTVTLVDFRFPKTNVSPYRLKNDQLDFRLQVDLRYMNSEGAFAAKTVILPGLDRFWECSADERDKLHEKPKPDRTYARADSADGSPCLDIEQIGAWDTTFRVCARALYEMRVTVFDVERINWLDRVWDVLRSIGTVIERILPFDVTVKTARSGSEWTLKAVADDAEAAVGARMSGDKSKTLFIGTGKYRHDSGEWFIRDRGVSSPKSGNHFELKFKATELSTVPGPVDADGAQGPAAGRRGAGVADQPVAT